MKKLNALFVFLILIGCSSDKEEDDRVLSSENKFITFSFQRIDNPSLTQNITGNINNQNNTINVVIPTGGIDGDISELIPTFTVSNNASVFVASIPQTSGVSLNNFSTPIQYKVVAENGDEAVYQIVVTRLLNDENLITSFLISKTSNQSIFRSLPSKIDSENLLIRFHNPHINISTLKPTFEIPSGASIQYNGSDIISGLTSIDFSSSVSLEVIAENGDVATWTIEMTKEIVDLEDFLRICPLDDPNINEILNDFEFRLNGQIITNFPCVEPYYIMDEPSSSSANSEYYTQTAYLQGLRFMYYLDYDNPYILPWANSRLYDWVKLKIDGINFIDGVNGGFCCTNFNGKTFISVGNTRTNTFGNLNSSDRLEFGFSLMNIGLTLHEARHVDGFPHTSGCCVNASICDQNLDLNNPSSYGIMVWWNRVQWESVYNYNVECEFNRSQLTSLFNPNIWSNFFCSGSFTYDFPPNALSECAYDD